MSRKVLILDTSMLCCWLQVPGKETCGKTGDQWDFQRVNAEIEKELKEKSTFVLPLASIIETGNHIAQATGDRYTTATKLAQIMREAADSQSPWAAFTDQSELWDREGLKSLAERLPQMASQQISIGDLTITTVAEHYARAGFEVEIFTADEGLKAYQPTKPAPQPRRRK